MIHAVQLNPGAVKKLREPASQRRLTGPGGTYHRDPQHTADASRMKAEGHAGSADMVGANGLSGQSSCCARLDVLRGGRDLIVPLSSITSPGSIRIVVVLPAP